MFKILRKVRPYFYEVLDTDDGVTETVSIQSIVESYSSDFQGITWSYIDGRYTVECDGSIYHYEECYHTEKQRVKDGCSVVYEKCHLAKNLYNAVLYYVRHLFFADNDIPRINKRAVRDKFKHERQLDYTQLPAHIADNVVFRAVENMNSFLTKSRNYIDDGTGEGKPRLPRYKEKTGYYKLEIPSECIHTDKNIRGHYNFHKGLGFSGVDFYKGKPTQVVYNPRENYIEVYITYTKRVLKPVKTPDINRVIGIDLGLDNFVAVVNNIGLKPFIVDGKGLKSINQFYNKKISEAKSELSRSVKHYTDKNGNDKQESYTSRKIQALYRRRGNIIHDRMLKIARYIINYCIRNGIDTVIVGWNKGIKQGCKLKNFNTIPYYKFLGLLDYMCYGNNINFIKTEESYTSGTSFLDDETPTSTYYDKSRRIHRGMFVSNKGIKINADINAAYQVIKKVLPDFRYSSNLSLVSVRECIQ